MEKFQVLLVGFRDVLRFTCLLSEIVDCTWLVSDHLGSPRIILGKSGSLADTRRRDFMPFGEDLGAGQFGRTTALGYEPSGTPSNPREKFATYERDDETGLDFAQARYYQSKLGRFTGVDPYNIILERQNATDKEERKKVEKQFVVYLDNPQRWNRYYYSLNNPLLYTDPNGEDVTIYYRQAGPGGASEKDFGHVLIYVRNDETGEAAYFD
jgi:RHS repeat-associated protein